MINTIDGRHYQNLIDYGIRNLVRYCDKVNDLNVFPVPDGDTGTNMVKTLQNGFTAIAGQGGALSELSKRFAKAVVFGARGNSGVIVSQFFKGFSECFYDMDSAGCDDFITALENGVKSAYRAVSNPVEGTVLTVLREATEFVKGRALQDPAQNINDIIALFLEKAKTSLENTPNLLPILKSAGVVDSGGAGIIYVFEGMDKYLNNETISPGEELAPEGCVDYSRFDSKSSFDFGYCTEFLLQLTEGGEPLVSEELKERLEGLGDSLALVFEEDKVKVHVHTKFPEAVLAECHKYGEFLSLKIENMSVQHAESTPSVEIFSSGQRSAFGVVAVAYDETMKDLFLSMGADAVIFGRRNAQPSTKDFLKAFEEIGAADIFVFPNSKNSNLAALSAGDLVSQGTVRVFDTRSVAECYAALSMMDFECQDRNALAKSIRKIIQNVYAVRISQAAKDAVFDGVSIKKEDFVAFTGSALLGAAKERIAVAARVVETVLAEGDRDTVTLFAGKNAPQSEVDAVSDYISKRSPYLDVDIITTANDTFDLILSFE